MKQSPTLRLNSTQAQVQCNLSAFTLLNPQVSSVMCKSKEMNHENGTTCEHVEEVFESLDSFGIIDSSVPCVCECVRYKKNPLYNFTRTRRKKEVRK